ncbi:MAG: tetratricopeptide repeat protein [Bacteroidetes bacterium]|nr:tetratricopeptide repeat protein [Bacteroidota bacterium]
MKKNSILFIIALCFIIKLNGQTPKNIKIINSKDLIKKGSDLYDDDKFDEAYDIYKLIPKNDTNYSISLYEQCLTLVGAKKYDEAIALASNTLKYNYLINDKTQLYSILGNALDKAKKFDESVEVYNKAIAEFPYNNQLHYNLALSYFRNDQLDKAEEVLFTCLKLNTFHQASHYLLGYINLKRGKLVPAIMAFNTSILLNTSSKMGNTALKTLENLYNGELDGEMLKEKFSFPEKYDNPCFDEIEPLIKSNFAMNKKYEVKSKLSTIVVKTDHLVFEKLKKSDNKDVYNQFYLPFYSLMMSEGYFEGFSYFIFSGIDNEDVKAFMEKNKSKLKKFQDWAVGYIVQKRMYQLDTENEKKEGIKYFYNDDDKLYAFGNFTKGKTPLKTGEWSYVNKLGSLESFGDFVKDKKEGKWKSYYLNGKLKEDLNYNNSDLDGFCFKNYNNGEINIRANFKNGKLDGEYSEYNTSGVISEKTKYINGLIEGKYQNYFAQGQLYSETEYKGGKKDGSYRRYFINGNIDQEASYKNNMVNGKYIEFFQNGNIYAEGEYKDDMRVGYWKEYYYNKQLKEEGKYDDKGRKVGVWKTYFTNGVLEQEETFSLNGKQNGNSKNYTKNGELLYTYTFKNELLTEITCYNKAKAEIGKYVEKKGSIDFKLFTIDGKITLEGLLKNGSKEGLWKKYDVNGILLSEENYKNNNYQGAVKTFYKNGNLKSYCEYEENERNGLFQSFYKDGTLKQEGYYNKGNAEGSWYSYHDNGNFSEINNYLKDKLNGYQETFDYFGKKSVESYYSNDFMIDNSRIDTNGNIYNRDSLINGNGLIKRKNLNGTLAQTALYLAGNWKDTVYNYNYTGVKIYEGKYINGRKDGVHKWYFDNGMLQTESTYNYGEEEGVSKTYDIKGKLMVQTTYLNGRTENISYFFPNGKPELSIEYENGERNGYTKYYTPDGQFAYQVLFNNATPVSYSYKGKDGKMTEEKPILKDNGKIIAYFQNGVKSAEVYYKNGERNGKFILYFPNGAKREENNYKDDLYDGTNREWNLQGVLISETQFSKGNFSGYKKLFYDNGKIEMEAHYINDDLYGTCIYYDKNGKKIKILNYHHDELLNEVNF